MNAYFFSPSQKLDTYHEATTGFMVDTFNRVQLHTHIFEHTLHGQEVNAFLRTGKSLDESWPADVIYIGDGDPEELLQERIPIENELKGLPPESYYFG